MYEAAAPGDILAFLQRIDSTVLAGRNPKEAWIEFLKKNGGGAGTLSDLEMNYINTKLAIAGKGKKDTIDHYLTTKGYTGTFGDKVRSYLRQSATK